MLITLPDGPCPVNLLDKACKNASKSLLVEDCLPNALISSLKLVLNTSLSVLVLSADVLLLVLLNCARRLCSLLSISPLPIPIVGGGGGGISLASADESTPVPFCDCSAAIRLVINSLRAELASVVGVVSELDSASLAEGLVLSASFNIDERPPLMPAALSALSIAPSNPPPSLPWRDSSSGLNLDAVVPELTCEVWYMLLVDETLLMLVIIIAPK